MLVPRSRHPFMGTFPWKTIQLLIQRAWGFPIDGNLEKYPTRISPNEVLTVKNYVPLLRRLFIAFQTFQRRLQSVAEEFVHPAGPTGHGAGILQRELLNFIPYGSSRTVGHVGYDDSGEFDSHLPVTSVRKKTKSDPFSILMPSNNSINCSIFSGYSMLTLAVYRYIIDPLT